MALSFICSPGLEPSKWSLVSSFTLNPDFSVLWIPCVVMLRSYLDLLFSALLLWSSGMSCHFYFVPHQAILHAVARPALKHRHLIRSQIVLRIVLHILALSLCQAPVATQPCTFSLVLTAAVGWQGSCAARCRLR